jgi:hypothetical protein
MGTSVSKASVAIRAFGKAFGFIGRVFTPRSISFNWKTRRSGDSPVKRSLSEKDVLELEIAKIEHRLDSVYRRIAQGAAVVRQDKSGSSSAELDELLRLSHDLKDNLRAKRLELTRLERQTARNVRFQLSVSSKSEKDAEIEEIKDFERNRPPKRTHISPKLGRAIQSAAKKASFRDNSKQIIFENIVRDILEGDEELRRIAVSNLGDLRGSAARHILTLILDDPDRRVCAAALNALSVIGEPVSPSVFRRFVDSREDYLRLAALRGLARVGKLGDAIIFINHLEDRHPAIRKAAATYLGWRKEKSGVRKLIRALYDGDENVRTAAATALGHIRDDRAVMSLIRTLGDDDALVRKATKAAIEMIINEKINIDTEVDIEDPKTRVEAVKDWWRKVRIDKQLAIRSTKYAASVALGERDRLDGVSDFVVEESRADDSQIRRTAMAETEADTRDSKRFREKAEEEQKEPVERINSQATERRSRAASTQVLESSVESDFLTDKPLIESVKPEIAKEDKDILASAENIERLIESGEADAMPEKETPAQTEIVSENVVEHKQPLIEEQNALPSPAQIDSEEMQKQQAQAEMAGEESEEAFYQEASDQFDNLGSVAETQETSSDAEAKKTEQESEEPRISDSKVDSAATDNAPIADQDSESQTISGEEGIQDFGLDDLGIKVTEENQGASTNAESNETAQDREESESGDNEEYDFLLDS